MRPLFIVEMEPVPERLASLDADFELPQVNVLRFQRRQGSGQWPCSSPWRESTRHEYPQPDTVGLARCSGVTENLVASLKRTERRFDRAFHFDSAQAV